MIRLGTRASRLALAQAEAVAAGLRRAGTPVELVPMRTEGDRLFTARLADLGGKGLFVRDLERALAAGTIDVAVHSLKDLPAELPEGLCLGAYPERADPRDVLVSRAGGGLEALPTGARVGTGSPRRRAQLLALRPDLRVEPLRGNVDTRLARLERGEWDAVVVAAAGLARLAIAPAGAVALEADVLVPAVGQGILGVEVREGDAEVQALVALLDHGPTRACAAAERACLRHLGASCTTPLAAHAVVDGAGGAGRLVMTAVVASEDGVRLVRGQAAGPAADAAAVGRELAERLLADGAAEVTALRPGRWVA